MNRRDHVNRNYRWKRQHSVIPTRVIPTRPIDSQLYARPVLKTCTKIERKNKKVQNHIAVTSRMVLFYFNFRGFAKRLKRTLLFGSRSDVT